MPSCMHSVSRWAISRTKAYQRVPGNCPALCCVPTEMAMPGAVWVCGNYIQADRVCNWRGHRVYIDIYKHVWYYENLGSQDLILVDVIFVSMNDSLNWFVSMKYRWALPISNVYTYFNPFKSFSFIWLEENKGYLIKESQLIPSLSFCFLRYPARIDSWCMPVIMCYEGVNCNQVSSYIEIK